MGTCLPPSIFHPTPDGFRRWTVVVAPEAEYTMNIVHTHQVTRVHDAWNYLLEQGKDMAAAHGINPEDLILSERCPQTTAFSFDFQRLRPGSHQSRYRPALPRARPAQDQLLASIHSRTNPRGHARLPTPATLPAFPARASGRDGILRKFRAPAVWRWWGCAASHPGTGPCAKSLLPLHIGVQGPRALLLTDACASASAEGREGARAGPERSAMLCAGRHVSPASMVSV